MRRIEPKKPINRVSSKQWKELALRAKLKAELVIESGNRCMTCGGNGDFRGLSLSHVIPLSRGGKTTRENCILQCLPCHSKRHGINEV